MQNAPPMNGSRLCPLCDRSMDATTCPAHGVPTLQSSVFQPSEERITIGSVLSDRFRIDRELGSGSIGSVFSATQLGLSKRVAVKVLKDLVKPGTHVRRFYQEAHAVSLLSHPNLVAVLDFGVDGRTHFPYLVMDFVDGVTLRKLLELNGQLPERRALSIARGLARGLAEAHAKNVIHRDLKPENIMVAPLADGSELVKILDFGMATVLTSDGERAQRITATGTTVGTPLYMSPEQVRSSLVDFRSDLYSLGCILFELLAGKPPFVSDRVVDVMTMHLKNEPPSLSDKLVDGNPPSPETRDLVRWLLEKQREKRPKSTAEVADTLDRLVSGSEADRKALQIPQAPTEVAAPMDRPVVDSGAGLESEKPTLLKPKDYDSGDQPDDPTGPYGAVQPTSTPPDPASMDEAVQEVSSTVGSATDPASTQAVEKLQIEALQAPAAPPKNRAAMVIAVAAVATAAIAVMSPKKAEVVAVQAPPGVHPAATPAPSMEDASKKANEIRALFPDIANVVDMKLRDFAASPPASRAKAFEALANLDTVKISCEPADAHVFVGTADLGACPVSVPRPSGGSREIRVVAPGYQDQSVAVTGKDVDPVIRLTKTP